MTTVRYYTDTKQFDAGDLKKASTELGSLDFAWPLLIPVGLFLAEKFWPGGGNGGGGDTEAYYKWLAEQEKLKHEKVMSAIKIGSIALGVGLVAVVLVKVIGR